MLTALLSELHTCRNLCRAKRIRFDFCSTKSFAEPAAEKGIFAGGIFRKRVPHQRNLPWKNYVFILEQNLRLNCLVLPEEFHDERCEENKSCPALLGWLLVSGCRGLRNVGRATLGRVAGAGIGAATRSNIGRSAASASAGRRVRSYDIDGCGRRSRDRGYYD